MSIKYLAFIALCGALGSHAVPLCSETITTAGGELPNRILPSVISEAGIKEIQLAAFLEQLETAFFTAGADNITQWGTNGHPNDTLEIVNKIAAQEEVHLQALSSILNNYNAQEIPPCNYTFPVSSTEEFFEVAHLIGSVGIGATIGLSQRLAVTDPVLVEYVSSILTVESRHDAFFRHIRGGVPNPAPFDTGIDSLWAYNTALSFIVPGSCPFVVPVPVLPRLTMAMATKTISTLNNGMSNTTQNVFTWDPAQESFVSNRGKPLLVGWVNQVDTPVYTPLNITSNGKGTAEVPRWLNGVAFAAVTTQRYGNVNDLAMGTLAGPVVVHVS